ncbi:MAG: gamma-glutamylcyclotransferase family protein [Solirubrobacterales bacterium]
MHGSDDLYFAYGSNMDSGQMAAFCGDFTVIGPCRLPGFRLAFVRRSPRWHAGAADIVRAEGCEVWGLLYHVPAAELALLDAKEASGNVLGYRRRAVRVDDGRGGPWRRALTYEVISKAPRELRPHPHYLRLMVDAARRHGLPGTYVARLEALETDAAAPSAPPDLGGLP